MAPVFDEFCLNCILKTRGGTGSAEIEYRPICMETNGRNLKFPCQLFINGQFVDAENGVVTPTINPANEKLICQVTIQDCPSCIQSSLSFES